MTFRSWLRQRVPWFTKTPVYAGNMYRDTVTGESLKILTVGTQVLCERQDAQLHTEVSVPVDKFRAAIEAGFIVRTHDESGRDV